MERINFYPKTVVSGQIHILFKRRYHQISLSANKFFSLAIKIGFLSFSDNVRSPFNRCSIDFLSLYFTVNLLPWSCTGDYTVDQCSETTLILCRPLCLFSLFVFS